MNVWRPTHGKGTVSRGVVRSGLAIVNPPDKFRHRAICASPLALVSAASTTTALSDRVAPLSFGLLGPETTTPSAGNDHHLGD